MKELKDFNDLFVCSNCLTPISKQLSRLDYILPRIKVIETELEEILTIIKSINQTKEDKQK